MRLRLRIRLITRCERAGDAVVHVSVDDLVGERVGRGRDRADLGSYARILLATKDLNGTFARLQASDPEVVQEPTEQPYGVRDCAFRDPAGNLIRVQELR